MQNEWDPARTDSNDYATYDLFLRGIIVPWVRERARRSCQRSCLIPTEIAPRSLYHFRQQRATSSNYMCAAAHPIRSALLEFYSDNHSEKFSESLCTMAYSRASFKLLQWR